MTQFYTPPFTLYEYRASPFCIAIRIALKECNAVFTTREVDLQKPRTTAFLKRSPFGSLPALVEHRHSGESAIFESSAILLFLSERFSNSPLGFSDLYSRSKCFSWLSFISSELSRQIWLILHKKNIQEKEKKEYVKDLQKLESQLKILEKHLTRQAYLVGDYSIADTLATPILDLLELLEVVNLKKFPKIISWRSRLRARSSYEDAWPKENS